MGVYVFKTDVLLKLLKWGYPTSNDFGSETFGEKPVEKAPKFYPAEDVKKPLVNKRKPKPTKLRQGFRKTYKEKHPLQKSVTVVAKAGAEKWNTLSSGEKVHYEAKAAKAKLEYEKLVKDQTQRN